MEYFTYILLFFAGALFFLGFLRLIIEAFGVSPLWGLACLFVPPMSLLFVYFHWEDTKGAFYAVVAGVALAAATLAAIPPSPAPIRPQVPNRTDQIGYLATPDRR